MINLVLCYPEGWAARGQRETVVSEFVPPLGMVINSENFSGSYKVTGWGGSSDGTMLSSTVYVELEEAD